MSTRSCAVRVTIFSNGSIIPTGFKFTELHALTLAARSYALLIRITNGHFINTVINSSLIPGFLPSVSVK